MYLKIMVDWISNNREEVYETFLKTGQSLRCCGMEAMTPLAMELSIAAKVEAQNNGKASIGIDAQPWMCGNESGDMASSTTSGHRTGKWLRKR